MGPASQKTQGGQHHGSHPLVSVVIVNYNAGIWLQDCLDALARQTQAGFEAIIIDNASTDGSLQALTLPDQRFRIHKAGLNLGFAKANNLGADLAKGDWLATLNPDAFPRPDWLEQLLAASRKYPDAAVFGSTQLMHDHPGLLDGAGDCMSFWGFAWRGGFGHSANQALREGEVFSACAAAALYRLEVFRQAGGFCEALFCYNEDVDIGFRLRLMGYRAIQAPKAVVSHVGGGISASRKGFAAYHGRRNSLWVHIINMPWPLIILSLPAHIVAEAVLLAIRFVGCFQDKRRTAERLHLWRSMARGLAHGILGSAWAWQERSKIQARRTASAAMLAKSFCWSPLAVLKRSPWVRTSRKVCPSRPH